MKEEKLDIHPIAIHLSQTFVAIIPLLSAILGYADRLVRFKTINTPLLLRKIVLSIISIVLAIVQAALFTQGSYRWYLLLLSLGSLAVAVQLGMLGKQLINVILPGSMVFRGGKKQATPGQRGTTPKMGPEEIARQIAEKQAAKARAESEKSTGDK